MAKRFRFQGFIKEDPVVKPEWGIKRYCGGCGARFYDMRRDPIVCPKCGVVHDPAGLMKASRPKTVAPPKPQPKPALLDAAIEDSDDDDDLLIDDDDDLEEPDDDAEEDEAIEDASELGEDKDDMFEVMDNVEVEKGQEG